MTAVKKFFCIVLVLAVLTGMTSCASKGFDYKKMVRFSGKQDFELSTISAKHMASSRLRNTDIT